MEPVILWPIAICLWLCARRIMFQLYALFPGALSADRTYYLVDSKPIGRRLNLALIADRFMVLQYVANLVRVFDMIEELMPRNAPPLDFPWKRPGSGEFSSIQFFPTFVRKMVRADEPDVEVDFALLTKVYKLADQGKLKNTIKCMDGYPKIEGLTMTLHLFPLGCEVVPADVAHSRAHSRRSCGLWAACMRITCATGTCGGPTWFAFWMARGSLLISSSVPHSPRATPCGRHGRMACLSDPLPMPPGRRIWTSSRSHSWLNRISYCGVQGVPIWPGGSGTALPPPPPLMLLRILCFKSISFNSDPG